MNYIELIRDFWRSHEAECFPTHAIALYFHLVEINNITSWKYSFKRNNSKICADLGISPAILNSSRNRLKQAGILDFKTINGSPNVTYSVQGSITGGSRIDSQTTYLYIFRNKESDDHKIGVSKDVDRRMSDIASSLNVKLELVSKYPVISAYKVESILHIHFKDKHVYGEWYKLNQSDIDVISKYAISNKDRLSHFPDVESKPSLKPNKTLSSDVRVEEIYNLYPSRCVVKNSSTSKSKKNKDKIAKLIDEVGYDKLSDTIKWYVEECKTHKTYMMNFSTFLNNLPEIPEEKKDINPITQLTDRQGNVAQ